MTGPRRPHTAQSSAPRALQRPISPLRSVATTGRARPSPWEGASAMSRTAQPAFVLLSARVVQAAQAPTQCRARPSPLCSKGAKDIYVNPQSRALYHPSGPAAPPGRARSSPWEGASEMSCTARPTCMRSSTPRRSTRPSAHPVSGASLRALLQGRPRYLRHSSKPRPMSPHWPGGTAGPRPTLPPGGRLGDDTHSATGIRASERTRRSSRPSAHPGSGASLSALLGDVELEGDQ